MGMQRAWLSGGPAALAGTGVLDAWFPAGRPVLALREEGAAQRGLGNKTGTQVSSLVLHYAGWLPASSETIKAASAFLATSSSASGEGFQPPPPAYCWAGPGLGCWGLGPEDLEPGQPWTASVPQFPLTHLGFGLSPD